jgi:predicted nucleotidyltransferase
MENVNVDEVQKKYDTALQMLIEKVQKDPYILAAVLLGSLSHDAVWQKSDIDLMLVTQETRLKRRGVGLVELGVNIHALLVPRSEFRKMLEGSVQGSFMHSFLSKGMMLFCREAPLTELFEARHRLSERDRAIQLLRVGSSVLPGLTKAEKWFHAKRDFDYCSFWILKCVDALASIELLLHGDIPGREVIHPAMAYNPTLFHRIYTDLLHKPATEQSMGTALGAIRAYLHTHIHELFGPIFDYLQEEGEIRSITEMNHHFERHFSTESVDTACEWLADEGLLRQFATPMRLTDKSRVEVEEAAYYFSGKGPN